MMKWLLKGVLIDVLLVVDFVIECVKGKVKGKCDSSLVVEIIDWYVHLLLIVPTELGKNYQ